MARATVKTTDKDRGYAEIKREFMRMAKGAHVKAGLLGTGEPREGEMTNVRLGLIHEFGAPNASIPERSFLRASFDKHRDEYWRTLGRIMRGVVERKITFERGLGIVGARMAGDIKNFVTVGPQIPPPNTEEVYERKLAKSSGAPGDVRTLIDTGRMINSVSWEVKTGRR